MREPTVPKNIVLYDGDCGICTWSVSFILSRDPNHVFYFASLSSDIAKTILTDYGVRQPDPNTFYYIESGRLHTESEGALRVTRFLNRPWRWLRFFLWVPRRFRDGIYRWIAMNRYRFSKTKPFCRAPSSDERDRFLDL